MRTLALTIFSAVLLVIALLGIGAGVLAVVAAVKAPDRSGLGIVAALGLGAVPFAIGTVALGALGVMAAIDSAARDQLAATNRVAEITLNEARHAAHHRSTIQPAPR